MGKKKITLDQAIEFGQRLKDTVAKGPEGREEWNRWLRARHVSGDPVDISYHHLETPNAIIHTLLHGPEDQPPINMRNWNLNDVGIDGVLVERVDLSQGDLARTRFNYDMLADLKLQRADLRGAKFSHTVLNNLDLSHARLNNAHFKGGKVFEGTNCLLGACCLSNLNLRNADLRGAVFENILVEEKIDLRGADLRGADFSQLTHRVEGKFAPEYMLDGCIVDATTKLPPNEPAFDFLRGRVEEMKKAATGEGNAVAKVRRRRSSEPNERVV